MSKVKVGDWVRTPEGVGLVNMIEEHHNTLPVIYPTPVSVQFSDHETRFAYINVVKVSFLGFVFNGPLGWRGFGQNPMLIAVLLHIFAVAMVVSSLNGSLDGNNAIIVFSFAVILVTVLWVWTYFNYKRTVV